MCEWFLFIENQTKLEHPQLGKSASNLIPKIRTTASVIWLSKDNPVLCEKLKNLITEEKFRYEYNLISFRHPYCPIFTIWCFTIKAVALPPLHSWNIAINILIFMFQYYCC